MKNLLISRVLVVRLAIILLLAFSLAFPIWNFYFNRSDSLNVKEQGEENLINLTTGVIDVGVEFDEYDENAKEMSENGLGQFVSNSTSAPSSSSTSATQGVSSQNTAYIPKPNYAALTGLNFRIKEGDIFNPLVDLKIKATDRNGTDITNKVEIINNVNTSKSGHYSVVAKVVLQDNTELTKTFSVEVVEKILQVKVTNISLSQTEVEPTKAVSLKFIVDSSKSSVIPLLANVNGTNYPIIKNSDSEYSVQLTAPSETKVETIALNFIQMSDGSTIAVNQKMKLTVLKQLPTVEKLLQTVNSSNGKLAIKLQVTDKDIALEKGKPLTAILYDENHNEVNRVNIYTIDQSNNVFTLPRNGKYYFEVFGFVNRNYASTYEWMQLYAEELEINTIDKSSLTGKNISIKEGEIFDAIKDLQLTATNENGEDITSQILIEGDVDTKTPGEYVVKASVQKTNGQLIQKSFNVTVQPVQTNVEIEQVEILQDVVTPGMELSLNLVVSLSKDYIELDRVIIDEVEYAVEKVEVNDNTNQITYQVLIKAPQTSGEYEFNLSKLILSNDEEVIINEKISINLIKVNIYHEPIALAMLSDEEELVNQNIPKQVNTNLTMPKSTVTTVFNSLTGADSVAYNSDLIIEGTALNSSGQAPVGQLSVTLPTKVAFIVDAAGSFIPATGMTIANNSACDIDVSVSKFTDPTNIKGQGITVVQKNQLENDKNDYDRSFVSLSLRASGGTNGTTVELLDGMTEAKLVTIAASGISGLDLLGSTGAGNNSANNKNNEQNFDDIGAKDSFVLTFKIAKNK